MKTSLPVCIICLLVLGGCQSPPVMVNFFSADGYIEPYRENFNEKLTFVFQEGVKDEFTVTGPGVRDIEVQHFRKSLKLSLYYTFVNSFEDVNFADQIDSTGVSVVLYRVRPASEVKSRNSYVSGYDGYVSSGTITEVAALFRYDGIIYKNGRKTLVLDNEVFSEKSTLKKSEMPDVFRDGMKMMCEDLYKEVVKARPTVSVK